MCEPCWHLRLLLLEMDLLMQLNSSNWELRRFLLPFTSHAPVQWHGRALNLRIIASSIDTKPFWTWELGMHCEIHSILNSTLTFEEKWLHNSLSTCTQRHSYQGAGLTYLPWGWRRTESVERRKGHREWYHCQCLPLQTLPAHTPSQMILNICTDSVSFPMFYLL